MGWERDGQMSWDTVPPYQREDSRMNMDMGHCPAFLRARVVEESTAEEELDTRTHLQWLVQQDLVSI